MDEASPRLDWFNDNDVIFGWRSPEESSNLIVERKDIHITGTWYIRHYTDMDIMWQLYQSDIMLSEPDTLLWCPPETQDIRWFRNGTEVIILRLYDGRSRYSPAEYQGSHFQSDVYERYSWPQLELLGRCKIKTLYSGARLLVGSPRGDLVVVQWWHQGEAGLEFIQIDDIIGDSQLAHTVFTWEALVERPWHKHITSGVPADEFICTEPVFSPSGRYIAFGQNAEWDHLGDNNYISSLFEDNYVYGSVIVLDWDTKQLRKFSLTGNDPMYYSAPLPDRPARGSDKHIEHILFLNERAIAIAYTNGWQSSLTIKD